MYRQRVRQIDKVGIFSEQAQEIFYLRGELAEFKQRKEKYRRGDCVENAGRRKLMSGVDSRLR